ILLFALALAAIPAPELVCTCFAGEPAAPQKPAEERAQSTPPPVFQAAVAPVKSSSDAQKRAAHLASQRDSEIRKLAAETLEKVDALGLQSSGGGAAAGAIGDQIQRLLSAQSAREAAI